MNDFEQWCGCQLPEDYREFITTIGIGVGPYYGLFPIAKIHEELGIIHEDHNEDNGKPATPSDPFGLHAEVVAHRGNESESVTPMDGPQSPGGFIPISHHGCEYMTVLTTGGEFAGMVFDTTAFETVGSQWCPSSRPPRIVEYRPRSLSGLPAWPTFADWIAGGLKCFDDLEAKSA